MMQALLSGALLVNAVLAFGYRVFRFRAGGPRADVLGGAVLAALLALLALLITLGLTWARWPALVYALLFGVVVMPVWTLAVFIPLRPGKIDYAFISLYWGSLVLIAVAAVLV